MSRQRPKPKTENPVLVFQLIHETVRSKTKTSILCIRGYKMVPTAGIVQRHLIYLVSLIRWTVSVFKGCPLRVLKPRVSENVCPRAKPKTENPVFVFQLADEISSTRLIDAVFIRKLNIIVSRNNTEYKRFLYRTRSRGVKKKLIISLLFQRKWIRSAATNGAYSRHCSKAFQFERNVSRSRTNRSQNVNTPSPAAARAPARLSTIKSFFALSSVLSRGRGNLFNAFGPKTFTPDFAAAAVRSISRNAFVSPSLGCAWQ